MTYHDISPVYLRLTDSNKYCYFVNPKQWDLTQRTPAMNRKNMYVERRPEGDFAVRRPGSERASAVEQTQAKAIERAREISPGVAPDVERVRHTNRGKPDQWRKA
jgi:hypothetical protein